MSGIALESARANRPRLGFTLVEAILVVVIMGIVLVSAAPRVSGAIRSNDLRSARSALRAMIVQARATAVSTRRETRLHFAADSAWITTMQGGAETQVAPARDFAGENRVTLSASSSPLAFQPTGLRTGTDPLTVSLSRDSRSLQVVVSGYGRVQ
jgi:Tfp pilus assembly protein FimT